MTNDSDINFVNSDVKRTTFSLKTSRIFNCCQNKRFFNTLPVILIVLEITINVDKNKYMFLFKTVKNARLLAA